MWVVVGLGNPGRRYAETRHNLGFMVVDALAARAGARFVPDDLYHWASIRLEDGDVVLMKPRTYVNRSGEAVAALRARRVEPSDPLLVVVDDIHLPFGRLRLRPSGSAGGHNGLRSIEAQLQSHDYARLRVGVSSPEGAEEWADHVLGGFDAEERAALPEVVERAADAVHLVVQRGLGWARPRVNAPPPSDTREDP